MAMIDMSDLSRFTGPEVSAPSKPRNLSNWRDGLRDDKGAENGTMVKKLSIRTPGVVSKYK
jgi:hypothetical protein